MNYYQEKQHCVWHREQLAVFKKSESFLHSDAFALEGQKTLIWLGNDGSVRMDAAEVPEKFSNAATPWEDWRQKNCSEAAECIYNKWVESQKKMFKETNEYKNSKLAEFVYSAAYDGSDLPHFDGIEVYENGNIELCTGEKFKDAVISLERFTGMNNHYELKKREEWKHEQIALFKETERFKESEAFKIEGKQALVLVTRDDGSVILDAASPGEKFSNALMPLEDWKKDNYSEIEEVAYNKMVEARLENFKKTDQFIFKEEKQVHQQEAEECCMSM
jgi:hypothetical protein